MAVTAAAMGLGFGLTKLPAPGGREALEEATRLGLVRGVDPTLISVGVLGVAPLISAFIIVELAALLVPAWRPLRVSGHAGRRRLRPGLNGVFLVVAALQTRAMLEAISQLLPSLPLLPFGLAVLAGAWAYLGLARLIDERGLGSGPALLLSVLPLASQLGLELMDRTPAAPAMAMALLLGGALSVAFARALGALPAPSMGVMPLVQMGAALSLLAMSGMTLPAPSLWGHSWVDAAIFLPLALLYGLLFARPGRRAPLLQRARGLAPERALGQAWRDMALGLVQGLAVLLLILGLEAALVSGWGLTIALVTGLNAGAALMDVLSEARARRRALVSVWPLHHTYALDLAVSTLETQGVPVFVRSRHLRPLGQFFAPYAPMELLVPVEQEAEARALVEALLGPEGAPDEG
ncbi:MAG: hypothetical protein H6741_05385 [Alphaproteobacteria bacterium]|nr:hypothetical protein [Alphaproteobacteria bacterium]MCB9792139.1 hypothetical protein [Alphaproteobacteria bacterium]